MFKSTAEFDKTVRDILVNVRDGETWKEKPSHLEEDDFYDALQYIAENKYVINMSVSGILNSSRRSAGGNPRMTRPGLEFIEAYIG